MMRNRLNFQQNVYAGPVVPTTCWRYSTLVHRAHATPEKEEEV